jgi:hypothetical protein
MRSELKLIFIACATAPIAPLQLGWMISSAKADKSSFVNLARGIDPVRAGLRQRALYPLMLIRNGNEIYCTLG